MFRKFWNFAFVFAVVLGMSACSTTSVNKDSVETISAGSQFTQEQLAAALRTVSLRIKQEKPARSEMDEILEAADSEAAYALYSEKVEDYVYSEAFRAVLRGYCQQMFGMSGSEDNPELAEPCELFVYVVMNDLSYTQILMADYMVVDGVRIENHSSNAPSNLRAGFLTLKGFLQEDGGYYGNGFGFNYVRSSFNVALCDTFPTKIQYGIWDPTVISQKYANTPDISCAECHGGAGPDSNGGLNELRRLFIPFAADGTYNASRDLNDVEPAGFDGVDLVEPNEGVEESWFVSKVDNVRDLAEQMVETEEFTDCAAMRFMTLALGLQSAGTPGNPISNQPELPENLKATSSADEEMFNRWRAELDGEGLKVRPWLVKYLASVDYIGRQVFGFVTFEAERQDLEEQGGTK